MGPKARECFSLAMLKILVGKACITGIWFAAIAEQLRFMPFFWIENLNLFCCKVAVPVIVWVKTGFEETNCRLRSLAKAALQKLASEQLSSTQRISFLVEFGEMMLHEKYGKLRVLLAVVSVAKHSNELWGLLQLEQWPYFLDFFALQ